MNHVFSDDNDELDELLDDELTHPIENFHSDWLEEEKTY